MVAVTLSERANVLASLAALIAALAAMYKFGLERYRSTLGSKRELRRKLNRLACGVTTEYVGSLLGPPAFQSELRSPDPEGVRHVYFTKHALVLTLAGSDDEIFLFSVTIIDRSFHFSTDLLTFGQSHVTLGRTRFRDLNLESCSGRRLNMMASRAGEYAEHYYYGNPGAYQRYYFSNNDAGVGDFPMGEHGSFVEGSLAFRHKTPRPPSACPGLAQSVRDATIDTFTVLAPGMAASTIASWEPIGVDRNHVRVLRAELSFGERVRRWRLRRQRTRARAGSWMQQ